MDEHFLLDCSACVGNESEGCEGCIVRFVVERDDAGPATEHELATKLPIKVGPDEARALRVLADAGLVPRLRHLKAVG